MLLIEPRCYRRAEPRRRRRLGADPEQAAIMTASTAPRAQTNPSHGTVLPQARLLWMSFIRR